MKISDPREIPHQHLRPFFNFWNAQRGWRPWPKRAEITLQDLRGAAANAVFCRVDGSYRDLDSLRLVNVGSTIERATGRQLTGLTVGQLLRGFGSSPEFTFCFSEYGLVAAEGCCTYNEGHFPWPGHHWLGYRRLVMPLGDGDEPDGLFVVIDLNAVDLGLVVPETLREFDRDENAPAKPWSLPPLQLTP